jgi:hypothetical protein
MASIFQGSFMLRGYIGLLAGLTCATFTHLAMAQGYEIDPAANPAKARFFALAQEQFNENPDAMFNTTRVDPSQRQAVFECGMKAVLADIPETDAQRLVDMIEGRAPSDPALAKWFQLEATVNQARHDQVAARAEAICPQFKELMK